MRAARWAVVETTGNALGKAAAGVAPLARGLKDTTQGISQGDHPLEPGGRGGVAGGHFDPHSVACAARSGPVRGVREPG